MTPSSLLGTHRPRVPTCHPSRGHKRNQIARCVAASPDDHPGPSTATAAPSRRAALQLASVGALHALALRCAPSADAALAASAAEGALSPAALARQLDARVSTFTLSNGMRFLVSERKAVPTVSMHTYADVGAFDETDGATGLAHLLEHLAFKGTPRIGTTDFKKESSLLDAMDDVFYSMLEAGSGSAAAALERRLEALSAQAAALSVPNAYGALLSREGAVGLNAATTHDSTKYYCSLPANKLELWFALEAERFQAPVFREVYSEKKVVLEERRARVDNSPLGPFQEEFAARALGNNYRRPVIGYERDIQRLGRREVAQFFAEHYGPASLTVSISGDVNPGEVCRLAERYFGGWGSLGTPGEGCNGGANEEALAVPAGTDREVRTRSRAGPAVLRAYYRPCIRDLEATAAMDMVSDALTGSRSARLYRNLVLGGAALSTTSFATFPAEKHPSLFAVYGIPAPGRSAAELDAALQGEVAAIVEDGPTASELRRYQKAARAGLLGVLQSNEGLAAALGSYQVLAGDWRDIAADLERAEALTPRSVAAAAAPYLRPDNSFVGYVEA